MPTTNTYKKQSKRARRPRRDDLLIQRHTMTTVDETAPAACIGFDGHEMYIEYGGTRIAVRGHPDTPQARTWISLVEGVKVLDLGDCEAGDYTGIEIIWTNPSPSGALS